MATQDVADRALGGRALRAEGLAQLVWWSLGAPHSGHRFKKQGGRAWLLHGIPVDMSRALSREFPSMAELKEIPGADHNDLLALALPNIVDAMSKARES